MLRIWLVSFMAIVLFACGHKDVDLSGDGPVKIKDFMQAFPPFKLPVIIADSNIKKIADSTIISRKIFTQFIPDSSFSKFVKPDVDDLKINPVGNIHKEEEDYLLTAITQKKRVTLVAFVLDKKKKYQAALQLYTSNVSDGYKHSLSINTEPTFTISREKGTDVTNLLYTRNGYAYNNGSGMFIKVVDDTNEGKVKNDGIINPIDTLQTKNKFSGDYVGDKKNFISVRDGKNASNYTFFIHFEKNDGDCIGELKGNMAMNADNKALYQQSGDPCEIDFIFEDGEIVVKERGNCGNHRGIKCYFNDSWPKKKVKKPKKAST